MRTNTGPTLARTAARLSHIVAVSIFYGLVAVAFLGLTAGHPASRLEALLDYATKVLIALLLLLASARPRFDFRRVAFFALGAAALCSFMASGFNAATSLIEWAAEATAGLGIWVYLGLYFLRHGTILPNGSIRGSRNYPHDGGAPDSIL